MVEICTNVRLLPYSTADNLRASSQIQTVSRQGLGLALKFLVFRVVRTQEFGSEFRRHLPKLSAVL